MTLTAELKPRVLARAKSLDLPPARYVRQLVRNDSISPVRRLREQLDSQGDTVFTYVNLPLSLSPALTKHAKARAAKLNLSVSEFLSALCLADLAAGTRDFLILGSR